MLPSPFGPVRPDLPFFGPRAAGLQDRPRAWAVTSRPAARTLAARLAHAAAVTALALLGALGALTAVPAQAQTRPADAPRGRDHPVLARFPDAWLAGYQTLPRETVQIPTGAAPGDVAAPRGQVTRLLYLAPAGRGVAEVQRHLQAALERAGAVRRDACAEAACGARDFAPVRGSPRGLTLARDGIAGWGARALVEAWQQPGTEHHWYGTLTQGGRTLHVAVLTAQPGQRALAERHAASVVLVVEPDDTTAAATPLVVAAAIVRGLETDGRVPLYALRFDDGRAELNADSRAQVEELARALQRQPEWRVALVGHSDNRGAPDSAVALSRARAQAVLDDLVRVHRIVPQRLQAAGVGPYAPLAPHATDSGRTLNRRVEVVLQ
jgi:outer membrane protein OmpA-like peptidoglycan-associated protein